MRTFSFSRLFALFLIVPVLELITLVWIGERVGFWPTIGLVVFTAFVGSWLAKREGWHTFQKIQNKLASGQPPGKELTDGLIILVSGVLLLTPGVLTDVIGFLGLLPPSRNAIRKGLQKRFQGGIKTRIHTPFTTPTTPGAGTGSQHPIEDAEVIEEV